MDLPRVLAADPVAAARAFHVHVVLFLTQLLGCQAPESLPPSAHLSGSPLEGVLGTAKSRQSAYPFSFTPHRLRVAPGPAAPLCRPPPRTLSCSPSMGCQSPTLPSKPSPTFWLCRKLLTPCPSCSRWYAADPARLLPVRASSDAWFDPFDDVTQALPPCLSWPRAYLDAASPLPAVSWTNMLLYDVRRAVVQCGLHKCRPATCWKGFWKRIHYCRLGFWHRTCSRLAPPARACFACSA